MDADADAEVDGAAGGGGDAGEGDRGAQFINLSLHFRSGWCRGPGWESSGANTNPIINGI